MSGDPNRFAPCGSKVALTVLVVLVVLSPWPFGSAHLRTTQAIALVSLATALAAFLWDGWHRQLQLPPRAILWPLLGLWALAVFQLIPIPEGLHRWIAPGSAAVWHPDVPAAAAVLGPGPHPISLYPEATRRWLSFTTGVIALALAAAPALRARRLLLRASTAVVGGAVLVAVYGLAARLAFGNKLYGVWSVPTVAPFGPFVSKNHFAGYVELAALLAIGLASGLADEARRGVGWLSWIERRRSKWIVTALGAALVLALAVPVSLSRGGVVSLCAGLLVFGVLRLWTHGQSRLSFAGLGASAILALLATVAVAAALPADARSRVLTLTGVTSDQSGSYRIALWRDTLRLVGSSPVLGSGFGAYADSIPRFKTGAGHLAIEHAENDPLEFASEAGLAGVGLAAASAIALFVCSLKAVRDGVSPLSRALLAAALASAVAASVHSGFDFNLRIPSNALTAALVAALLLPSILSSLELTPSARAATSLLGSVVLAAALLMGVSTRWSNVGWGRSQFARATHLGQADLRRAALINDTAAYLQGRPAYADPWVYLAWLRHRTSREDALALAGWGVRLDPTHETLARMSETFRLTTH